MNLPELRPRQPFTGLAFSAAAGIFAADRWPVPPLPLLVGLSLAAIALFFRPHTFTCWFFVVAAFFGLHELRYYGNPAREVAQQLAAGPRVAKATGIVSSEPEKPATFSRTVTARFKLRVDSIVIDGVERRDPFLINVSWAGPTPAYGDRISLSGSASNLAPARNPGQFDFAGYSQRKGVYSELSARFADDCHIESPHHGNPLLAWGISARQWIRSRLALDLESEPECLALIDGVVLGMAGETPEEMRTLFQRTGTIHLFAVSGLNVAMLATIAFFLLQPLRLPRAAVVGIVIVVLVGYTLITGLRTSSVRSTVMATVLLAASLLDRRAVPFNSLAAAALIILAWDTNQLFAPGFQFSFTLVFIIMLLSRRIQRRIEPVGEPDPFLPRVLWGWPLRLRAWGWKRLCMGVAVMTASWFGSLAFMVGYFHLFSPSSFLANLVSVPLAFTVLALGLATTLSSLLWLRLAVLFNNANWLVAKVFLVVLRVSAAAPGGYVYIENPHLARPPACEFTVLDLGDGGGVHLRCGPRDWLLDCGGDYDYSHFVLPYLRTRGVNRLDGLLLTHGDAHHIGGTVASLNDLLPRALADSPLHDRSSTRAEIHQELAVRGLGKAIYQRGDYLRLVPGTSVRVLYPPAGLKRNSSDDKAFVLQLECAGTRVLFMSDSGFSTEQWLLENEPDLRSDVLVKGHHAKDLSGTMDFLARVQPQAVVCGQLDPTKSIEPLDEWEQQVRARGIAVFRQDRTGAVRGELRDDGSFTLRAFLDDQTFRSRAR